MNTLPILTWESFNEHEPCYDPQSKYGEFSGTILDILKDERIPAEDRIWAFTRNGIVDERTQRIFACKCVRDTPLADGRKVWDLLTDERSRNAVIVAERYANGEATQEELAAARAAAAWAAARDAVRAAADAAWAAARAAAWAAAWAAARDAVRAAADAAWAAAWAAQVQFAIELLTSNTAPQ